MSNSQEEEGKASFPMNDQQMLAYEMRVGRAIQECDRQLKEVEALRARAQRAIKRK